MSPIHVFVSSIDMMSQLLEGRAQQESCQPLSFGLTMPVTGSVDSYLITRIYFATGCGRELHLGMGPLTTWCKWQNPEIWFLQL